MKKRNFVIRTIRDGQAKINGLVFRPSSQWLEYDGRLDGMRYAFGLYWTGDEMQSYVHLWGTEEAYRAEDWAQYCKEHPANERPECVDGWCNWDFWPAVTETMVTKDA